MTIKKNYLLRREPSPATLLDKFGMLTDEDMERYVGDQSLYDEDETYRRRRAEYVERNYRNLLERFVEALRITLDDVSANSRK